MNTMATAVQIMQSSALGTPAQSSVTTAPVREHTCLFTHDLRRKQKRWNDGRLKYHTFNRRVMVYDERGNFVGDVHWREDYDLADGDELELERGGVLIQVGECVGSRDQDLSDLIDKRAQERAQRHAASAARRPPVTAVPPLHSIKPNSLPQKHLHDVLGTPSGHHGRAVLPKESPYEERRQRQSSPLSEDIRPAKKLRREISPPSKSGYAQNLFGATLSLSGRPSSQVSVASRSTPRHAPPYAVNTQSSMNYLARLHSSTRPETGSYAKPISLDESNKSPVSQKQRRRLILDQEKGTNNESSTVDRRSTNKETREAGKAIEPPKQSEPRTGQLRKPLVLGDPNRSDKRKDKKRPDRSDDCSIRYQHPGRSLTDLTEEQAGVAQQDHDEPRTELKIKPRKKRGLLMVSERDAACGPSVKSKPTEIPTNERADKTKSANVPQKTSMKSPEETRESAPRRKKTSKRGDHLENEDFEELQCVNHLDSDSRSRVRPESVNEQSDKDKYDTHTNLGRRSLRLAQQAINEDTILSSGADQDRGSSRSRSREDLIPLDEMPPPHLAKLGRKSIKSREIIGLVFNDDESNPVVSARHGEHAQHERSPGIALNQNLDKPMTNEGPPDFESQSPIVQSSSITQPEQVSLAITTAAIKQPKPTITNPATRGKKAAKPSDAAGQMPQCPLSAELAESSLRRNSGLTKAIETRDKGPANLLPGFSKANGGPWSREAHDLFDFKRPQ